MINFKSSTHGQRNTDLEVGGSHSNGAPPAEDDEFSSGPFDIPRIPRIKHSSVERFRQWSNASDERQLRNASDELQRRLRNASDELQRRLRKASDELQHRLRNASDERQLRNASDELKRQLRNASDELKRQLRNASDERQLRNASDELKRQLRNASDELERRLRVMHDNQEIRGSTLPDLVDKLDAKVENLFTMYKDDVNRSDYANMLDLKEIRDLFMNSGYYTAGGAGAFVKTALQSILLKTSYGLQTDIIGQVVGLTPVQLKAKLDELNWIVSKLKLQKPAADPTILEVRKSIIPAVVARVELSYKIFLSHNPSHKNDSNSGKQGSSHSSGDDHESMNKRVKMLTNDLSYIRSFLNNLEDNSYNLRDRLNNFNGNASIFVNALLQYSAFDNLETDSEVLEAKQLQAKLHVLNKIVIKMKHEITSPNKLSLEDFDDSWYTQVFAYEKFRNNRSALRDLRVVYKSLEATTKLCLLCFAIIPENEVVKKRFMTYWWVGEGLVSPPPGKTYEEAADRIFEELVKKKFIEPVNDKYPVDSYKMNPDLIRSAVIVLAKEARFFYFDDKGNPIVNFKSCGRTCLVDGFSQKLLGSKNELDLDILRTILNVNETDLYFFQLKWFSKLKNVKVLYLGRWQTSATHFIEVQSIKFLTGLKSMQHLRFLSLQGISRIRKLPRSVCKLLKLGILDLRACHDLETLPDGIGSLRMLTHLDISECYRLDYMPEGIATLSELQVLKGFVISDRNSPRSKYCTLNHLSRLEKLRKLSIYTNKEAFPDDADVTILLKFMALQKLTINWGERAFLPNADSNAKRDTGVAQPMADEIVFETLEKLDLKHYPITTAPSWLLPGKLPKLHKLYIKGGNLQNLSPFQENDKWPRVEVLRLKSLPDLKMDSEKLRSSFPGLIYLEIFQCPKLASDEVLRLKP